MSCIGGHAGQLGSRKGGGKESRDYVSLCVTSGTGSTVRSAALAGRGRLLGRGAVVFASASLPGCQLRWGRAAPRAAAGAPWKPGQGGGVASRGTRRASCAPQRLEYKKGVIVGGVGGQGAPKVVVVAACQQAQRTGRHLLVHRSLVRLQAGGGAGAGRHARAPLHKPPPTHSSPEERHHAAGQKCRPRQAGCPAANRGARPVPRTSRILSCAGVSANCWSLGLRPEMKCPGGSSCHCSRAEGGGKSCEGTGETVARHATHKHTGGGSGPRGRLPISPPQNSRGKHGRLRQTARTRPLCALRPACSAASWQRWCRPSPAAPARRRRRWARAAWYWTG